MDRQCGFLKESFECLQNYTEICLTDTQAELIDPIVDVIFNLQEEMCTRNSSIRQRILQYSECMKAVTRNQKSCTNDIQVAFEYINANFNSTAKVDLSCCAYWRMKDCNDDLIKQHCSENDAQGYLDFNRDFNDRTGGRMMEAYCGAFKPGNNTFCDQLPPPGTPYERPKNKKLRSVLTRVLKAYTSYLN